MVAALAHLIGETLAWLDWLVGEGEDPDGIPTPLLLPAARQASKRLAIGHFLRDRVDQRIAAWDEAHP
ncbi:MAG: hypothetical protein ACRD03_01845 [Acidimicrobiales bacterium]